MKAPWQIMTAGDWLIIMSLLIFSLAGIAWLAATPAGSRVVATSGGETCFVADLSQRQTVSLEGPLGKTQLMIDEEGARVTSSPCPRKLCIAMGPAKYRGDLVACVPNQIMIRIENGSTEGAPYDLLSR